jgi:3D (Asp-Asp-Asp) domain-containing protein
MRSRFVDIALIAGLVAVAGAIMWTLFNLGGSPRPTVPATTPPSQVAPATPAQASLPSPPTSTGVVPVDPNATPGPATSTDEATTAPATPAPPQDASTDAAVAAAATEPVAPEAGRAVPAADAAPVPSGTVALERVGFSFVTGGAGACGIVLEPWQHVAVSRELLDAYGCGARVSVTLDDSAAGRSSFTAVVADTMNPQFSRTANVYVSTDEDAFAYGLTSGSITPVD